MTGPNGGQSYYASARRAGGLILIILASVLMLVDAARADYAVDSIQLGLILSTGCVLFGIDAAIRRLTGGD